MCRSSPLFAVLLALGLAAPAMAADWHMTEIPTATRVRAVATRDGAVYVQTTAGWFRAHSSHGAVALVPAPSPHQPARPNGALPDGGIATGRHSIARAWLAGPTRRYDHGVLGDAIEADALVIERRDGRRETLHAGDKAVFEDLTPRIVDLGDGRDSIVLVKSDLARGAALAVIGERDGRYRILDETPPLGAPHRWLDPAGIADFNHDRAVEIAVVVMPHAVGRLELWSWRNDRLHKVEQVRDTSNHAIGSRALDRSAVADFDGDEIPDLAIPTFDQRALRLLAFNPPLRELARVALPEPVATDIALMRGRAGSPLMLFGLADGRLVAVGR